MNAAPGSDSRGPVTVAEWRNAPAGAEFETVAGLLAGTASLDVGAFAALYDCTCSRLYGVALRMLRDPELAEETTQGVYLQVWTTAHRFDPAEGSAQAWLTTLTHRRAVDRVRCERAHRERVVFYDNGVGEVLGGIEGRMACAGVASIPERQREAIVLAYYSGQTYPEVAEHIGVDEPTITSRIRAGLTQLGYSASTV